MSIEPADHTHWLELAAAQALHALEPDEERQLAGHLAGCDACRRHLDEYTLIAAQLGAMVGEDEPVPAWSDIRPELSGPRPVTLPARPWSGRPRRRSAARAHAVRRAPRLLAAAAAVTVLAAGGVIGSQLIGGGQPAVPAAAACRADSACRLVALHGPRTVAADVLVRGSQARLVPVGLTTPPAQHVYVLWQLPRDGSPIPLMQFATTDTQLPAAALARPFADTVAFAVSVEPASPPPTHPTVVLATGAAGA